jgi:hypothetical protein
MKSKAKPRSTPTATKSGKPITSAKPTEPPEPIDNPQQKPFNVLSFVGGLVFMVGGVSFLGQQNGWFTIDLGTVLPIVAIVGGLAAIFGNRRSE